MSDLIVKLDKGLSDWDIGFIQQIEGRISRSLEGSGFTQTATTKSGNYTVFEYCWRREESPPEPPEAKDEHTAKPQ